MRQSNLSAIPKSVPSTRQQKRRYKNFLGFCFYSANRKIYAHSPRRSHVSQKVCGEQSAMSKTGRRKYFLSLALGSRVEPLGKSKNALILSCNTKFAKGEKLWVSLRTWEFLGKRFLGLLVLCYLGKYFFKYIFCYLYLNILPENIAMLRMPLFWLRRYFN